MNKAKRVTVTMDPETEKFFNLIKQDLQEKAPELILTDSGILVYMLSYCTLETYPDIIADNLIFQVQAAAKKAANKK